MNTKKIIFGLLTLAAAGVGIFFYAKNRKSIKVINLDYPGRKVTFEITAGGKTLKGSKSFDDKGTTEMAAGKYKLGVSSEGKGFVLFIMEGKTMVRGVMIDLEKKTTTMVENKQASDISSFDGKPMYQLPVDLPDGDYTGTWKSWVIFLDIGKQLSTEPLGSGIRGSKKVGLTVKNKIADIYGM